MIRWYSPQILNRNFIVSYAQQTFSKLLLGCRQHEFILSYVSRRCVDQLLSTGDTDMEQISKYIENNCLPKAKRLIKSKKICKTIKNRYFNNNSNDIYVWRCLICNKFYQYKEHDVECPSCSSGYIIALCPLYFIKINDSITFGVDPVDKPFYLIRHFQVKKFDDSNITGIVKYCKNIQQMIEQISKLELTTIVTGIDNTIHMLIMFGKSNPLTLYELKHIVFEIFLQSSCRDWDRVKCWECRDVDFKHAWGIVNGKLARCSSKELCKLSDETLIHLMEPCYIDFARFYIDKKPRKKFQVIFDQTGYHQGHCHSCNNNNPNSQGNHSQDRIIKEQKVSNVNEIFEIYDFQHSPVSTVSEYTTHQMQQFMRNTGHCAEDALTGIVKEVIHNGYEEDLLPVIGVETIDDKIKMIENIKNKSTLKFAKIKSGIYTITKRICSEMIEQLSKTYKIFDKQFLISKMRHKRHKMMGYPLDFHEMLALLLYCDGECNYNLCKTQREHKVMQKWPYFHCILNSAIEKLSEFETHYEHLYTGICGVFLETSNQSKMIYFQSNVSFSTDLNIALQFPGDSGIMIGLNMQRIFPPTHFTACDVSWISSIPTEKEVLCTIGSRIRVYETFVRKRDNTQWIVFVDDEPDENRAFKSMFGSLANIN